MIAGTKAFIEKAGSTGKCSGGMRQAGVIAARDDRAGKVAGRLQSIKKMPSGWRKASPPSRADDRSEEGSIEIVILIVRKRENRRGAVRCASSLRMWAQDTGLHSVRVVTHCDVDRAGSKERSCAAGCRGQDAEGGRMRRRRMKRLFILLRSCNCALCSGSAQDSRRPKKSQGRKLP